MFDFPPLFIERMKQKFGNEFDDFIGALNAAPVISVRLNPEKNAPVFEDEEKVLWNEHAYYLKKRPAFVLDPLHHAGAYYVQEASSMIFPHAIDFNNNLLALDLCAAPGGKSTLLLSLLNNNSFLISNEIMRDRVSALVENIVRWGYNNVAVTNNKVSDFLFLEGMFDVVLVDAPCSGEGMFRKDKAVMDVWSAGLINRCSADQKDILHHAVKLLKPGGTLIYSTCTFGDEENENNVKWFYEQFAEQLSPVVINAEPEWGLSEKIIKINNVQQPVYACYPHKIKGEGLFISAFRVNNNIERSIRQNNKKSSYYRELNRDELKLVEPYIRVTENNKIIAKGEDVYILPAGRLFLTDQLHRHLRVQKCGVHAGTFKNKNFVPAHDLAVSNFLNNKINKTEIELEAALKYLKKEPFEMNNLDFKGWGVVTYKNLPLGWIKNIGNRFNNHFPSELKIRLDIDRYREKIEQQQ